MKFLPEVPTEEMLNALTEDQDESGGALPLTPSVAYGRLYAAAPEVKDEPVAWEIRFHGKRIHFGHNAIADYRLFDPNATSTPLYAAPPDVEAFKAEIERLKGAIRKHRLDVWGDGSVDHAHDTELYEAISAAQ